MKTLLILLSMVSAYPAQPTCERGQTSLREQVESGAKHYYLQVCDAELKYWRELSRGELFKMYNGTKGAAEDLAVWGKQFGVDAKPENILAGLKGLPENEFIGLEETDKALMDRMAGWYQKYVASAPVAPPKMLSETDVKSYLKERTANAIAACLTHKGTVVMSDSKDKDVNGCMCGTKPFRNYVDFKCENQKLVPAGTAPGKSGSSGSAS